MLELSKVNVFYGSSHILHDITFTVKQREIVCLLGRNGAGKTTTIRATMGLTRPQSGSIRLFGEEITGKKPFEIAHMGVGFVYEDRRLFPRLTVKENLEVARRRREASGSWTEQAIYDMFPVLKVRSQQKSQSLSGGEQQMLAIARTMMGNPQLMLIDEPMEGLAPLIIKKLQEGIVELKKHGVTILLSEQNVWAALAVSEMCYIIDRGQICFGGTVQQVKQRDDVLDTYLGVRV